jgi:hypothetical protein
MAGPTVLVSLNSPVLRPVVEHALVLIAFGVIGLLCGCAVSVVRWRVLQLDHVPTLRLRVTASPELHEDGR